MKRPLFLLLVLVAAPVMAKGYLATYDMLWKVGLTLEAEATETLSSTDEFWTMTLDADASIGSATEATQLVFEEGSGWTPLDYRYEQRVFGSSSDRTFRFNWNERSLSRLHLPESNDLTIDEGTLDPLGFRLQLAHLLSQGQPIPTSITLIDGDGLKTRQLVEIGEETLSIPYGEVPALKFALLDDDPKKQFEFWLAPSLNYQLVKLEKRDNRRFIGLTLKTWTAKAH